MTGGKFRDVAETLAAEYAALPPGTRVASENAIAQRFGIGRAAARSALEELRRRHLVRRVQGEGTFVSRRIEYRIASGGAPSWSLTLRAAGVEPRSVVRGWGVVRLPVETAAPLGVSAGTPGFELRRQSFADGLPSACGIEWVPQDLVPELPRLLQVEESLNTILRDVAWATPVRARASVTMDAAPPLVAAELGLNTGDPVWAVKSVNRDGATGRVVGLTSRWIRADAIRVVVELGR